jgi:hypothetical protein
MPNWCSQNSLGFFLLSKMESKKKDFPAWGLSRDSEEISVRMHINGFWLGCDRQSIAN